MIAPRFRPVVAFAVLLGACLGSGLQQQESSYRSRLEELDKLAQRGDAELKAAITVRKQGLVETYQGLPADKNQRGDGLGRLNQQLHAAIAELTRQVEAQEAARKASAAGAATAERQRLLDQLAGSWKGGGMDLSIDPGGKASYHRTSGGSEKSAEAPIKEIDPKGFTIGAFGLSTRFRIDALPHQEGGAWKMTVDGVELTRQVTP